MYEYCVKLSKELNDMLLNASSAKNMEPQQFIDEILNRYLTLLHNINYEEMADGYRAMGELNLELAK